MMPVVDRRFERGDWLIALEVLGDEANTWLEYLNVESSKRGWVGGGGINQLDPAENSGSLTIHTGVESQSILIVWERKRGGPLKVRARPEGSPALPEVELQEFFDVVSTNCQQSITEPFYRRNVLYYEGRAWTGELWLNSRLRLGPPSVQYDSAILGPRVVLVEATLDAISWMDANARFQIMLREVSVFLSVVMRTDVHPSRDHNQVWVFPPAGSQGVVSEVRQPGYIEVAPWTGMPAVGISPPMLVVKIQRPQLERDTSSAFDSDLLTLPDDTNELWNAFTALPHDKRQQFIRAGTLWQASFWLWRDYPTLSFALRVAAIEALKPAGVQYEDRNIYHVVEGLLGRQQADRLRGRWIQAQVVRSGSLHAGELWGAEFARHGVASSFVDPAFNHAHEDLWYVGSAAITEWLVRGGVYTVPGLKGPTWRGRFKRWRIGTLMFLAGVVLGWLIRSF